MDNCILGILITVFCTYSYVCKMEDRQDFGHLINWKTNWDTKSWVSVFEYESIR